MPVRLEAARLPLSPFIRRRIVAVILLAACHLLLSAGSGWADSQSSSYAFGRLVVFDTVLANKVTYQSQRLLNVVALDDRSALRVVGSVAMPRWSDYVGAYANDDDKLIVLLWDRVEIYDLIDPAKPRFIRSLDLRDQGSSSPGYGRIEKAGAHKFILLNTRNTTELALDGGDQDWHVTPLPLPTAAQIATMTAPPESLAAHRKPVPVPLLLYESEKFRYELAWNDKRQPGSVTHRKYLRKIDKASGKEVSALLLASNLETID